MIHYVIHVVLSGLIFWQWYRISFIYQIIGTLLSFVMKKFDVTEEELVNEVVEHKIDSAVEDVLNND